MPSGFSSGLPLNIPPSQNKQNSYTLFYKEFVVHKTAIHYKVAICSQANTRHFKYNTACKNLPEHFPNQPSNVTRQQKIHLTLLAEA